MTSRWPFGARSTADQVLSGRDLAGQVIVITGANTGIGYETASSLAAAGASVVIACRSLERGSEAVRRIQSKHAGGAVEARELDLADLASVSRFCQQLPHPRIDTLICNAGVLVPQYSETADGFEQTTGVCHLGHFLLARELLPRILSAPTPRIVMVSSESHRAPAKLDFAVLPFPKKGYNALKVYGQAKLCNALMATELDRRYRDQGLMACYLHPGTMVTTDIGRNSKLVSLVMMLARPFTKNASQGAATTVFCATWPETGEVSGKYFSDCKPAEPSAEATSPEVAAQLWLTTEQLLAQLMPAVVTT